MDQMRKVTDDDIGIKVLYEPPSHKTASNVPSIDIVAIHGIGAHPDDTWRKKVNAGSPDEHYVNWLSDAHMLPAAIPSARIMRYGYESQWAGDETIKLKTSTVAQRLLQSVKRRRKEYPFRPLIFIAHCFGGLVVLKAVVDAKQSDSKWAGIYQSICGLLFFGTPFRGAGGLSQTELLRAIQSQYEHDQVQGSNFNILDPGNETLMDLMDTFFETRQQRYKAHLACFFEQKPSNVGAIYKGPLTQKFVVNESSGCLDTSESTEKYSLSRDHFNMNKFGKPTEEDFEIVREVIEAMAEQAPALTKAFDQENRAGADHDQYEIQFDISDLPITGHFVDRDVQMKEIEHTLMPDEAANRKIHVLHGLGGIGKTQLAIAYAQKYKNDYSAIVWVNGSSQDTVLQSLAVFAKKFNTISGVELLIEADRHRDDLKKDAQAALHWLALKGNRRWLMIFDNVDRDYHLNAEDLDAYDLVSCFPRVDHGCILITTRLPSLGDMGNSTEVTRLCREQAVEVLSSNCSRLLSSAADMEGLVERLGHLPLAIVQAGRYMRETGTNCETYLELYNTSWSDLQIEHPQLRDYKNGSVQTTWMISYNHVRQSNVTAAKLFQLWAHFHYHDIWFELFHRSKDLDDPPWIQDLTQSRIKFKKVMKTLLAYSLVECSPNGESYSIHPVVHDWCCNTIGRGQDDLTVLAVIIVGYAVPDHSARDYLLIQQRLLPHANRSAQEISQSNFVETKSCWNINNAFHKLGVLYHNLGKLAEAEGMCGRALDGFEKSLGPDHTSSLETVNNLGTLYFRQGKLAKAEEMYRRALDGFENLLGPVHTSTLNTVGGLGLLYVKQDKLAEAEKMFQRALEGSEKACGLDHTYTLKTVNSLGFLYLNQGKMAEAEKMFQWALDGFEKSLGLDHTSTLHTVNNLGDIYFKQGKHAEAEEMFQRALDGFEKTLPSDHTSILETVHHLGLLYLKQVKLAEAEEMLQRALEGFEKSLGPDHTSTLKTVNNLGDLYSKQGKLAEAERLYQRALDGLKKSLGPNHTSTLKTVGNLGLLYFKQVKLAEAEEMLQWALAGFEKSLGPDHTSTLKTVGNIGLLYVKQDKLAEAEEMFQRALDGFEKAKGPDHASTLTVTKYLHNLYARLDAKERPRRRKRSDTGEIVDLDPVVVAELLNQSGNVTKRARRDQRN